MTSIYNYGSSHFVIHNSDGQEGKKRLCPGCDDRILNAWWLKPLCSECKRRCVADRAAVPPAAGQAGGGADGAAGPGEAGGGADEAGPEEAGGGAAADAAGPGEGGGGAAADAAGPGEAGGPADAA